MQSFDNYIFAKRPKTPTTPQSTLTEEININGGTYIVGPCMKGLCDLYIRQKDQEDYLYVGRYSRIDTYRVAMCLLEN